MLTSLPFLTPFFLALRNMRTRRGRTLLTLLGIVLGVAVVLAIQVTNGSTLASLRQVFDHAAGKAALMVVPFNSGEALDEPVYGQVRGFGGVQAAAPALHVHTLLASQAASWQIEFSMGGIAAGNTLQLIGIDPELDPQVRVYTLTAGRMPAPEAYETVLPAAYAAEHGLSLEDDLVILAPGGRERLKVVGLLEEEGVALLNNGVVAFTPLNVVQDSFGRGGELDEIALLVEPQISQDPQALEELKVRLEKRVTRPGGRGGEVVYPAARGELVGQMLATYQLGLTFFSVIAIFVGAFLIYNTFSMTVVERTREIGMLRAIGMGRAGVLRMVLAEALILALAGSGLGVLAGLALARGLMRLLGDVVTSGPAGITIPPAGLVQSLAVGIGVTLGAALLPALQAARVSPLEALRARSRVTEQVNPAVWTGGLALIFAGWAAIYRIPWRQEVLFAIGTTAMLLVLLGATLTVTLALATLERLTRPLAAFLYGNEGRLGSANVRRSVGRTILTVASLMVSLTMIIGIASVAHSFEQDMTDWIDNALGGDLYVRAPLPMRASFGRQLASVPGVEAVTPTRILPVRIAPASLTPAAEAGDSLLFNAIDPISYRQVGDIEFAANQGDPQQNWARLERGQALFVSNTMADRYRLQQGDTVSLLTARGAQPFTVAAEVMDFTGQGQVIYGTYADLQRWFAEGGVDRFTIKVADGVPVAAVGDEIEARHKDRRHVSVQTTEAFKGNILDLVNQAFRLFDVLNLIGVVIGAMGVINTLTMNVLERQQEVGGLRSLGMTRGQVMRMVLAEALALGVMGAVYGLFFGYVLANVMILGLNLMVGYDLSYLFTPRPYLLGLLIALVVVQIAALAPARRAARVNIVEAIKHE